MSLVYADKLQTLDHLEDNIRRVIADIRPQMLEKVIENWTSRLDYIRASRGSLGTGLAYGIGLGHVRTAKASQCEPFAWFLCAAESKSHHSPQFSRHMP
ncbi:hypothetical protein TNCV_1132301 [Trichonephila clavipes]|nr:hypothetical protein TNCV_1132301 [Trichonephila clavipes]